VAFRRKALRGGRQLNVVSPADDDPVAGAKATCDTDDVAVAPCDFDVPPNEALAADLNPDVWPTRLRQHGRFRYRRHGAALAFVEEGRSSLANQEPAAGVVDFEHDRQRRGLGIDNARVMDALRPNLIVGHVTDPEALRRAAPDEIPVVILDDALSAPDSMIAEIRRALRKRALE